LFLICLGAFAYYQAGSWNSTTRFDLVRAIVERHALSIDAYHMNTATRRRGSRCFAPPPTPSST
jgi:hypothetical protein